MKTMETNRQSNMELLRIIAMFFILVGHIVSFMGFPEHDTILKNPIGSLANFLWFGFGIVFVDVFVFISGWFGINFKIPRLIGLLFQVLFFSSLIYVCLLCWKPYFYANVKAFSTVFFFNSNDYWFVKAYIGLYLMTPILNAYIEKTEEKQIRLFLICFFIFQTIYGWFNLFGAHWFEGGFSMISFIGIYVLARYIRLFPNKWTQMTCKNNLIIYFSISLVLGTLGFLLCFLQIPIYGRLYTYTNPLVIVSSVFLVIGFSKMYFKNMFINWIARSCLAIYLLHANELVLHPIYFNQAKLWLEREPTIVFLYKTSMWVLLFAVGAIVLDKLRIVLWERMVEKLAKPL